jgi:peptidoglycan/LPS O-acetylase OafA/YrhL
VELFWDDADPLKFLAQLLLIHPWLNSDPGWNIPSWSIGTEIFAYCLFPLAARALRLWPRIAGLALLGASIGFYAWVATGTGSLDIVYGTAPLRCLAGFLLGMLVYQQQSLVAALPVAVLSAGQIAALAAILLCLAVPVNDVLLIPPFLVLVAFTWTDAGWLARQLSRPAFQFLGEISYSVYLTHFSVILLLFPVTLALGSRLGLDPLTARAIWLVAGATAAIILSFGTYRLVEVPARRWLSGKWAASRADAALRQEAAA